MSTTVTVNVPETTQVTVDILGIPIDIAIVFSQIVGAMPSKVSPVDFYKDWCKLMDAIDPFLTADAELRVLKHEISKRLGEYMREYK